MFLIHLRYRKAYLVIPHENLNSGTFSGLIGRIWKTADKLAITSQEFASAKYRPGQILLRG